MFKKSVYCYKTQRHGDNIRSLQFFWELKKLKKLRKLKTIVYSHPCRIYGAKHMSLTSLAPPLPKVKSNQSRAAIAASTSLICEERLTRVLLLSMRKNSGTACTLYRVTY